MNRFKRPFINKNEILLKSISTGSSSQMLEVVENAEGFIRNSCQGSVSVNLFIGEEDIGESAIASLGLDHFSEFKSKKNKPQITYSDLLFSFWSTRCF